MLTTGHGRSWKEKQISRKGKTHCKKAKKMGHARTFKGSAGRKSDGQKSHAGVGRHMLKNSAGKKVKRMEKKREEKKTG